MSDVRTAVLRAARDFSCSRWLRFEMSDERPLSFRGGQYVIVDTGYVHGGKERVAGLRDLEGKPFVQKVFSNQDSTIYKLVPQGAPVSP